MFYESRRNGLLPKRSISTQFYFYADTATKLPKKKKVFKQNEVDDGKKEELSKMFMASNENPQKPVKSSKKKKIVNEETCELFDLYLELRSLKLDNRIMRNLLNEALNVKSGNEMENLRKSFPFDLPLTADQIEDCEEFLSNKENYDNLVHIHSFFLVKT